MASANFFLSSSFSAIFCNRSEHRRRSLFSLSKVTAIFFRCSKIILLLRDASSRVIFVTDSVARIVTHSSGIKNLLIYNSSFIVLATFIISSIHFLIITAFLLISIFFHYLNFNENFIVKDQRLFPISWEKPFLRQTHV